MRLADIYRILNLGIASVWLANGLYCKVMGLVPRHQEIVVRIVGYSAAPALTKVIGVAEMLMAIWVVSGLFSRMNAIFQILIVLSMNIIEFVMAPDLLLWGHLNIVFAFAFTIIVYFNTFHLGKSIKN